MFDRSQRLRLVLGLATIVFALPVMSHEPPSGLLIHLPLDGSTENLGRAAVNAEIVAPGANGQRGTLSYQQSTHGQAAVFDGQSAVRVPFDLHPDLYPQLTVTMWIKAEKGQQGDYLFSTGASMGPRLQYSNGQVSALGPRVLARKSQAVTPGQWVLVAGMWDYEAGSVAVYAGQESEAVGFDSGIQRDQRWARPDAWVGTYDDNLESIVSGIQIDDVRVYDRVLTSEELFGLAIGTPIEEEPQLGEPPLPPEEVSEPHVAPIETNDEPDPRFEMHRDRNDTGTLPGEDPTLDKLRRTQAPGGNQSEDVVRDVVGEQYEPGPTTDWEQAQEESRRISDEELEAARRSVGDELNPGDDRLSNAVRDQLDETEIPGSTDFDTRRQGLHEGEPHSSSASGQGRVLPPGELDVKPMEDGELYVQVRSGSGSVSAWSSTLSTDHTLTLDLGDKAIHTIEWYEKSDIPCKMVVYGYAPGTNHFGGPNVASFGRDECYNSANERSRKAVSLIAENATITALTAIGNTSGTNHLKGIRVEGFRISKERALTTDGAEAVAKRPRATAGPREGSRVSCPDGRVATGLKVGLHYMDKAKSPSMSALALICREVED
ncbi:MAG: hypothetical protein PVG42_12565 [Lysobacterales bacterium]|jgi:hypothetical protein